MIAKSEMSISHSMRMEMTNLNELRLVEANLLEVGEREERKGRRERRKEGSLNRRFMKTNSRKIKGYIEAWLFAYIA